jgi:hypothetical protein
MSWEYRRRGDQHLAKTTLNGQEYVVWVSPAYRFPSMKGNAPHLTASMAAIENNRELWKVGTEVTGDAFYQQNDLVVNSQQQAFRFYRRTLDPVLQDRLGQLGKHVPALRSSITDLLAHFERPEPEVQKVA